MNPILFPLAELSSNSREPQRLLPYEAVPTSLQDLFFANVFLPGGYYLGYWGVVKGSNPVKKEVIKLKQGNYLVRMNHFREVLGFYSNRNRDLYHRLYVGQEPGVYVLHDERWPLRSTTRSLHPEEVKFLSSHPKYIQTNHFSSST